MIVYKQVYKKDEKYYALMNYGYACFSKKIATKEPAYEIGKTYISKDVECNRLKKLYLKYRGVIPSYIKEGYYFWTKNISINENANKHLKNCSGAIINAVLKCEINNEDVLSYERGRSCIRAKQFTVLEEILC